MSKPSKGQLNQLRKLTKKLYRTSIKIGEGTERVLREKRNVGKENELWIPHMRQPIPRRE